MCSIPPVPPLPIGPMAHAAYTFCTPYPMDVCPLPHWPCDLLHQYLLYYCAAIAHVANHYNPYTHCPFRPYPVPHWPLCPYCLCAPYTSTLPLWASLPIYPLYPIAPCDIPCIVCGPYWKSELNSVLFFGC